MRASMWDGVQSSFHSQIFIIELTLFGCVVIYHIEMGKNNDAKASYYAVFLIYAIVSHRSIVI